MAINQGMITVMSDLDASLQNHFKVNPEKKKKKKKKSILFSDLLAHLS